MLRAAIYGASGYAGAEILRRLIRHPAFEIVQVCAGDHLGEPVSSVHLNLEGFTDLEFEPIPETPPKNLDVLILGLPHEVSHRVVATVRSSETRILDLSGAFRLRSPATYQKYYGAPHPMPDLLGEFVYGLPEINRERIKSAKYVASPGCFATCIQLGLLPMARAGWLRGPVETVGITGSSGSGATPSLGTHHPIRAVNLRTYRPLFHPHAPEVEESLGQVGAEGFSLDFVPVSAPLSRGIFATSFVRLPATFTEEQVRMCYRAAYINEPFVRVPVGRLPEVVAVSGSNYAEVGLAFGPPEHGTRVVTCFSALDNLMKGGAGQAVQNLNLMFGFDENHGLTDLGGFP